MNNTLEWLFQGFGTEIVTSIISLIVGGLCGYKIGINKNENIKQIQKAGSGAKQTQVGKIKG